MDIVDSNNLNNNNIKLCLLSFTVIVIGTVSCLCWIRPNLDDYTDYAILRSLSLLIGFLIASITLFVCIKNLWFSYTVGIFGATIAVDILMVDTNMKRLYMLGLSSVHVICVLLPLILSLLKFKIELNKSKAKLTKLVFLNLFGFSITVFALYISWIYLGGRHGLFNLKNWMFKVPFIIGIISLVFSILSLEVDKANKTG
jgi:hypothetical protein